MLHPDIDLVPLYEKQDPLHQTHLLLIFERTEAFHFPKHCHERLSKKPPRQSCLQEATDLLHFPLYHEAKAKLVLMDLYLLEIYVSSLIPFQNTNLNRM